MQNAFHDYLGFFEAVKSTTPSQSGLIKVTVAEAQGVLHKLGWPKTKGSSDGLYGPGTKGAWEKYATGRGLNPAFDRASGTLAWVHPVTLTTLKAAGAAPAAPVPEITPSSIIAANKALEQKAAAAPAPSSTTRAPQYQIIPEAAPTAPERLVNRPVLETQQILRGLGWSKLSLDGKYGPNTAQAWESSAKKRTLDPLFKRVNGTTVTVNMATWMKMKAQAGQAAKRYVPPSAAAAPAPAPAAPAPAQDTVTRSVAELQKLLLAIGFKKSKALTDGLYGPTTQKAWATAAANRKLPGTFVRVDGKTARVDVTAYTQIVADAQAKKTAAPAAAAGTVVKDVAELQALLLAVGVPRIPELTDGLYGPKTREAWRQAAGARKVPKDFTRVTGKTARVASSTYGKIRAEALAKQAAPAAPAPAPTPAAPAPASPVPVPGTVVKDIAELQALLLAIGFKKSKALTDGLYGPTTQKAWATAAASRKLPGTFDRVTGSTARVNLETYTRVKADATQRREKAPTPTKETVPSTVKISIKTLQQGLNGRGARPLLDTDGVWGSNTEGALKVWLAKQPGGTGSKYQVSGNRKDITLPRAYALSLQEASKATPAVPGRVDIPVEKVKKGLSVGGQPIGAGTKLDATTKRSLDAFITQMDGGNTGYKLSKDGTTVVRIRKNVADKLKELASQYQEAGEPPPPPPPASKPEPPPPEPAPDPIQQAAKQIAAGATTPIAVLTVQQAILSTNKYADCANPSKASAACVSTTGVWDEKTGKALIDILLIEQRFHPYWFAAFPMLVSADQRNLLLFPQQVEALNKLAQIYRQRQAAPPVQEPEYEPEPLPPPPPMPVPPALPAPVPEPEYEMQVPTPAAAPGQPAPTVYVPPQAMTAWANLVGALRSIETFGPKITAAIEEASATSGLRPEVEAKYKAWVESVNDILARAAQIIEQSPDLQQAIDAVGAEMGIGLEGLSSLEAYFADAAATTSRILDALREPFPSVLEGYGLAQAATLAARAGAVAARFGGTVWRGLMQLLGSRTVATVGATQMAVGGISDIVNGEVKSFNDYNRYIIQEMAAGRLSPEAGAELLKKPPEKGDPMLYLVVGGVILGGLALFLRQRD